MSFATNQTALLQEHFSVIEIDLPAFTSIQTCTLASEDGADGFYTPLSCDEAWDEVTFKTYRFATDNLPETFGRPPSSTGMPGDVIELDGQAVYPVVMSINENVTELKPGEGLAIQGDATITLVDFDGDPGPVDESDFGTFFGKLSARNILNNKDIRIMHYHVTSDGIYAEDDALTRYYIIDSIVNNGKGTWAIKAKDELSKLDEDKNQFPVPTDGSLRLDVNNTTTTIPVDAVTDWSTDEQGNLPYTIKIGDELMKVSSVANNQTASAALTVGTRGGNIIFTNTLSETSADSHTAGDDIQICHTSDDERIDDFLEIVLEAAGIPSALIPDADWATEIDDWHPNDKLNTVWHEPVASDDVTEQITRDFLLDIWFDPVDREVKLSAISVWKTEGPTVIQGEGINRDTFKIQPRDLIRYSRAFVYFNKPNKVLNDDIENYRALSININSDPEDAGLYDEPKTKEFPNSPILETNGADLLTQRTTARFGFTPEEYRWKTEEKFLNFATGDIATILTDEKQDFDGTPKSIRGQIISVQPTQSNDKGRQYNVKALTFEPAFADDAEFTISANSNNVNLHTFVGAPSGAVNVTIIIDGAVISSLLSTTISIFAGSFASGSMITLILENSAQFQGGGGDGGVGGFSFIEFGGGGPVNGPGGDGDDGGVAYDAQGIDTDIYLGGLISGHTALGTIRAPGGGGGGEDGQGVNPNTTGGDGGGGGAGSNFGVGGPGGLASDPDALGTPTDGVDGSDGDVAGNGGAAGGAGAGAGGDWGVAGVAGDGLGGTAGAGLIKGGATVNVHTDGNTGRFTNGSGDAPDVLD